MSASGPCPSECYAAKAAIANLLHDLEFVFERQGRMRSIGLMATKPSVVGAMRPAAIRVYRDGHLVAH